MKQSPIIEKLNQLSIEKRIDFIENDPSVYSSKNRADLIQFIKDSKLSNDSGFSDVTWYSIVLVELSEDLKVIDLELLDRYKTILLERNYYLLKLAVLDYILYTHDGYINYDFGFLNEILSGSNNRMIVQNFAILVLLQMNPSRHEYYFKLLVDSLKRTRDYRSFIRTFAFVLKFPSVFGKQERGVLLSIAENKQFGRAVTIKMEEVRMFYKAGN